MENGGNGASHYLSLLAWDEARKVQGIEIIDQKKGEINLQNGDVRAIVDKLVAQYEKLFGKASREARPPVT